MHNVFRTLQLILLTLPRFPEKKERFPALHFPPETPCRCFPESFPISLAGRYLTHLNNFCRREDSLPFPPVPLLPPSHSLPSFFLFSLFTRVWFTRHGGRRKKRTSATMIDHRKRKPSRLQAVRTFPMSEKHSFVKPPSVANTRREVGFARERPSRISSSRAGCFLREVNRDFHSTGSSSRAGTGSVGAPENENLSSQR